MSRVFLLAAFLLPSLAVAQAFEPGYVTVDGETLRGEVALGSEAENARGVTFRGGDGAAPVTYGVREAEAFGADDGRTYRRGTFQLAPRPDERDPDGWAAFARVVIDGPATLLAAERVEGRPVFFLAAGGEPVGLYLDTSGSRLRGRALYRQTLLVLLGGDCGLAERTPDLPYTEDALAAYVDDYNACADPFYRPPPVRQRAERRPIRVRGEVLAGGLVGQFRRDAREPPADDPTTSPVRVGAIALVQTPLLPEVLAIEAGVEVERGVARTVTGVGNEITRHDLLHGRLGLRLAGPVGPARLSLSAGGLLGTVRDVVVETGVDPDERDGLVRFVDQRGLEGSRGLYLEAGAGPRTLPVSVAVRAELTAFIPDDSQSAVAGGRRYGFRSLGAGLRARF